MKEYRSWSHFWRSCKSKYKPSVIRDSYFYSDGEDQSFYDESISKRVSTNKGVKSGIKVNVSNDTHSDKP